LIDVFLLIDAAAFTLMLIITPLFCRGHFQVSMILMPPCHFSSYDISGIFFSMLSCRLFHL